MCINPVYKKELKNMARTKQLSVLMVVFSSVLTLVALIVLYIISQVYSRDGISPYKYMIVFYMTILSLELFMLCLFVPSVAGGSIAGERERQTLDILLSTKMSVPKIIVGKLFSCISLAVLLGISSLPILAVTVLYGGIGLLDIYQSVMYVAFFVLLIGCIGVFCSCRFKKTTTATVVTYGVIIGMTMGTGLILVLLNYAVVYELGIQNIVHGLSYILLLNPIVTYVSILAHQLARFETVYETLIRIGVTPWIADRWILMSLLAQAVLMIILNVFSVKYLNPQNERFVVSKK